MILLNKKRKDSSMKFIVTIMPATSKMPVNSSTSIKNNSFTSRTLTKDLSNSFFSNQGQEGIILTSDELTFVSFSSSDFAEGMVSNTETNISVRISGKVLSHLSSDSSNSSSFNIESILSGYADEKFHGLSKGLTHGVSSLGNVFSSNLDTTFTNMINNLNNKKFNLNDLYEMNFKNTIELAKWALEYGVSADYRDVVIEIIINENISKTYILPDMFAIDYDESFGIGNGTGDFDLVLRQKRFSNRKIEIK